MTTSPRTCRCGCGSSLAGRDHRCDYVDRSHKERARQRRRHADAEYNRARYLRRIDYHRSYEEQRRGQGTALVGRHGLDPGGGGQPLSDRKANTPYRAYGAVFCRRGVPRLTSAGRVG